MNLVNNLVIIHKMIYKKSPQPLKYFSEFAKALNPISYQIINMRNNDQAEWKRIEQFVSKNLERTSSNSDQYILIDNLMKSNAQKLRQIVEKFGAIDIQKYGIVASHCAWLIVQHADEYTEFQLEYLELMQENPDNFHQNNIDMLIRRLKNRGVEFGK